MPATHRRHQIQEYVIIAATAVALAQAGTAEAACGQAPANLPGTWCWVDGAHVRVWYQESRQPGVPVVAADVRNAVESHLWPLYVGLLGRQPLSDAAARYVFNGGDGRYDIVLSDTATLDGESPLVMTTTASPPARFSIVRRGLPRQQLLSQTAHELMGGFLSAFKCVSKCRWLNAATAAWAEHLAYPAANTEHRYAAEFFANPELPLDFDRDEADPHKSGAYLFLLFLQQRTGGAALVRSIWEASERSTNSLAAIEATLPGGIRGVWREFVISNWNADPALVMSGTQLLPPYIAWDGLAAGVQREQGVAGAHGVNVVRPAVTTVPLGLTLAPLSAAYFTFTFDISVRSIEIVHNLKRLRAAGVTGAELVVFTKMRGRPWTIESNWDTENKHVFCRDRAAGRVDEMVIILANSMRSQSVTFAAGGVTPKLAASDSSCLSVAEGFEECRLEFPLRTLGNKTYTSLETQTWEITRPPDTKNGISWYPLLWTTEGRGASTSATQSTWLRTDWTIGAQSGKERMQVYRSQPPSGPAVQVAASAGPQITAPAAQTIVQVHFNGSNQTTTTQSAGWWEFMRPTRSAPLGAERIEGVATGPLPGSWAPGTGQLGHDGTIACRWSWPPAP